MPAIFTTNQRILNALSLKNQSYLYLAIGRTTPWDDENNPPTPLVSQDEVEELIYIKKISIKHLVRVATVYDGTPDVEVNGIEYKYIDDEDAYAEGSYILFLTESIYYDDIAPTSTTYRQDGILLNPKDVYGDALTDVEYLAASVGDQGELLYVDNHTYISKDPAQSEKLEFILTF